MAGRVILRHDGMRPTGGRCDHHWVATGSDDACPECGGAVGIVETKRKMLPVGEPIWMELSPAD